MIVKPDHWGSAGKGKSTPLRGEDQAHLRPRVRGASPQAGEYAGPYPRESLLLDGSDIPSKPGHCPSASRILEAPWTSGTATGPRTRTKGILHGRSEGVSRPGLVSTDPDLCHPDDINRDPRFNQYPYPDDDLDYDDDEEMETDYQNAPPGGVGDARVTTPASAGHRYYRPPATYSMQTSQGQTLGSPRSTHTDTDTAMEMGGLSMAPGGPDTHHVLLRAKALTAPGSMSNPGIGPLQLLAVSQQPQHRYWNGTPGLRMRPNTHQWIRWLMLPSENAYKGA